MPHVSRAAVGLSLWFLAALAVAACSRTEVRRERSKPVRDAAPVVDATSEQRAILATLPLPYRAADLYNGQAKFALCRSCHAVSVGAEPTLGPNLWGVFGRKSGAAPGFAYSEGLKRLGVTWTAETIDAWIANPRAVVPGTRMIYAGLEDARDRIDVVAYLKTVTTPHAR